MYFWRRWSPLALALTLYAALALLTVRDVGVVGETAIGWATGSAPRVLVSVDPLTWASGSASPSVGDQLGPLVASQVRPIETLDLGTLALPLAINSYTGGLPDWPARLLFASTHSVGAVTALNVLLGMLVIVGVYRFLHFHAGELAAAVAALVLAADWDFVFYKKVLGGTEIALQLAGLICLWALWDRRWSGGRHGLLKLGLGVGLGLLAKATFGISLLALLLTALLTRWDRPTLGPPPRQSWWRPAIAVLLLVSPLAIAALHHGLAVPADPHIISHDFAGVQWRRVVGALSGERVPIREGLGNLLRWAGDPLGFLQSAYHATPQAGLTPLRVIGWAVLLAGAALAWTDRHSHRQHALLRFSALFLLLQVGLLLLVARDLHHLAQAAPTLAITFGLATERLVTVVTSSRGPRGALLAAAMAGVWTLDGAWQLHQTDPTVDTIAVPTFTRSGQAALLELLRAHDVHRLVACDYELYGVLETLAPDLDVVHGWGAASRRRGGVLPALIQLAQGGHLLVVQASAPMIYNLRPSPVDIEQSAGTLGLRAREVGRLADDGAVLYAITQPR